MRTAPIAEIEQLASLYGHVVDHREWDRLDEVYAPDGVYDRTSVGGQVHAGLDAVRAYFVSASMPLAHHVTNLVVDRLEDGVAYSRAKYLVVHVDLAVSSGEYEDVWARRTDGWRLQRRVARPVTFRHHDEVRAIEEIKRLRARYCRYYDGARWEEFHGLFTDDLVAELPGHGRFEGPDAFIAGIVTRRDDADVRTVHQCHTPEIDVHGETASGIWAMFDYVDRVEADGSTRTVRQGYGHYVESYRLTDDGWRIAALTLTRIRVDDLLESAWPPYPPLGVVPR